MPLVEKSRAIVLHTTRQGDRALVLTVLDEKSGRCGYFLRRVGKGGTSAFHNLNVLDVVISTSPSASLPTLREYAPLFSLDSLRSSLSKSSVALFICEVLYRGLRSGDGDGTFFEFMVESIVKLDTVNGPAANFHLWWLAGFCYRMGFRPEDNWSEDAPLFDIITARFIPLCASQGKDSVFSAEDSLLLHRLVSMNLEEALALPLSAVRRQSFTRRMLDYLSYHLGQRLEIRSLDVLHAVFA